MGEMKKVLDPGSILFVGASDEEGASGRVILENLTKSAGRKIFPVNPAKENMLSLDCYPSVASIGRHVDLAVISVPSENILDSIKECAENGVDGAIILSAGPRMSPGESQIFETRIREIRNTTGFRVIGPDSSGFILPNGGLNISAIGIDPAPGGTALIAHGGTIESAMLYWGIDNNIGFSMFASLGAMADIDFSDVIDYLEEDYFTKNIMLYLEQVKDARKFLSAARGFSRSKPLVVLKPGKYPGSGEKLAVLTGREIGSDMVYDAAFKRVGIVRVKEIEDFYDTGRILKSQWLPRGPNLAIVTNSGALGVISCDTLEEQSGQLAPFSDATRQAIQKLIPDSQGPDNPVIIGSDATAEKYYEAAQACLRDGAVDGVLVVYTPAPGCDPGELGKRIAELAAKMLKTIVTVWMGSRYSEKGVHIMREAGIPAYDTPEDAVRAYMYMVAYKRNIELLGETPHEILDKDKRLSHHLKIILHNAISQGKDMLSSKEVKNFLGNYGIRDIEKYIGSEDGDPSPVEEWALRSMRDKDFGTVILFLSMNTSKRHKGFAVGLPPLSSVLARQLMNETGFSAHAEAETQMENFLVKYSNLVADFPEINEIEIEAALMRDNRVYAREAAILVDRNYTKGNGQYPHLAIMPYPARYIMPWTMRDGTDVLLRPIRAEDEPLMQEMFSELSDETLRVRFFVAMRADHRVFTKFCNVDYDREISLVVEIKENAARKIIGGGSLIAEPATGAGQFALLMADNFQKHGLGEKLLDVLIGIAQDRGLREIYGIVLSENVKMLGLAEKMGFKLSREPDGITRVSLMIE